MGIEPKCFFNLKQKNKMELREKLQMCKELKLAKLSALENDLGIPSNTLTMFMKGVRGIAEKFKDPLNAKLDLLLSNVAITEKGEVVDRESEVIVKVYEEEKLPSIDVKEIEQVRHKPKDTSILTFEMALAEFKEIMSMGGDASKLERLKMRVKDIKSNPQGMNSNQRSAIVGRIDNVKNNTYKN